MAIIDIITKWIPRAARVIWDGVKEGASDEEIRQRLASPEVIFDEELATLRRRKESLRDFVKNG